MKAIKCPNCGKNMYRGISGLFGKMWVSRMCCPSCGVEGPRGTAPTSGGSWRVAARLTREWIARMEADKAEAANRSFAHGIREARAACARELRKNIKGRPSGPIGSMIDRWEVTP